MQTITIVIFHIVIDKSNKIMKGVSKNPFNVTKSIDSAYQTRNILTDHNRGNEQIVCNLTNLEDESTSDIQEILNY